MLQVKTIALRAKVEPQVVNEKLVELGYQTRTRSKNCRFSPTLKGEIHSSSYTGIDPVHGHEYTVYNWDEVVAAEVIAALRPPTLHEVKLLEARILELEETVRHLVSSGTLTSLSQSEPDDIPF